MRMLPAFFVILMTGAALSFWGCGTATVPSAGPDNPLEACPESPNCVRSTLEVMAEADRILEAARQTLENMGAESIEETEAGGLHAVFRIAVFGFRDDVHLALSPQPDGGTFVHIRSASRTGYSDLGVNSRRVDRFFRLLTAELRK
ncbi:MAG: DUF1499 domain-containing protein [Candidatus Cyclonatronum sp.]|uniref:DUF1499 domain-containing protein n=1 Tax=Cyclonatronum sp. TaxID=3024185 RepID=UPI0025B7D49E|nr:DUF1499 domain-containing protein [Cyclonatronum sp.]MCC5932857.1 DUF1499 domain-containing protein [Balneolales bacterium]MCH8485647.1 DUF1499 domain-containing protein [Cyclonatronum sp.]